VLGLGALGPVVVQAQCPPESLPGWLPNGTAGEFLGLSGSSTSGGITASGVSASGELVVGGLFGRIGALPADEGARWDGTTWIPMPFDVVSGAALSFKALPNGELLACGPLSVRTSPSTTSPRGIARWNGTSWVSFTAGETGTVRAIEVLPNGDLLAGGDFTRIDGVTAFRIARFDGTQWRPVGNGIDNGWVSSIARLPSGDIVVAGGFTRAGDAPASRIARWDGTAWRAFGTGLAGGSTAIDAKLTVLPNGDLVVSGQFTSVDGVPARNLARFSGGVWSELGAPDGDVRATAVAADGSLIIAGSFTNVGGVRTGSVARWDGTTWSAFGTPPDGTVATITVLSGGRIFAGGTFTTSGTARTINASMWDGTSWSAVGRGFNGVVRTMTLASNGDLVVGGSFSVVGGAIANGIARQVGSGWQSLGGGVSGTTPTASFQVSAIAQLSEGDLVATGRFAFAGGVAATNIARWNGSTWSPLGTGISGSLPNGSLATGYSIAVLPNGDLIAAGSFTIAGGAAARSVARWNGAQWSAMGSEIDGTVYKVLAMPEGDIIAVGSFSLPGAPFVAAARWNGSQWLPLVTSGQTPSGLTLLRRANGDLLAGVRVNSGSLSGPLAGVVQLSGSTWAQFGTPLRPRITGEVTGAFALTETAAGLVAVGPLLQANRTPLRGVGVWNGYTWSQLDGGISEPTTAPTDPRYAALTLPNGDLAVAGDFTTAGGKPSVGFARYRFSPGAPIITQHPVATAACRSRPVSLSVAAIGAEQVRYQWRKGGVAIDPAANPSALTATLRISRSVLSDAGEYDCIITNADTCGSVISNRIPVSFYRGCSIADVVGVSDLQLFAIGPADFRCGDGTVDGSDFIAFINSFSVGDPTIDDLADIVGAGDSGQEPDGTIDADDFIAFINAFAIGC
jgi:hypothetical protein